MACENDSKPTEACNEHIGHQGVLARAACQNKCSARAHLEVIHVLVVLVQRLRQDEEREARYLQQFCASRLAPRRLLRECGVDGGKDAHEHEETVHFAKDVLRARVLEHDFMDFGQDLRLCGVNECKRGQWQRETYLNPFRQRVCRLEPLGRISHQLNQHIPREVLRVKVVWVAEHLGAGAGAR